jgi:DNA polymerase-4
MERIILHCDLNNFYASVECLDKPEYREKPLVVAGDESQRRGVVVAKNGPAKALGIKTGDTVFQARRKCPELIALRPDFPKYHRYSQAVQAIYARHTDEIEAFSLDECWLDVSMECKNVEQGRALADCIRAEIRNELGLTISVGVSFTKVFAKLGSDMKKPDATTVISRANFKEKVWPLPVESLLYVGPATRERLNSSGVQTIGDLARQSPSFLTALLGKTGRALWMSANGRDDGEIMNAAPSSHSVGAMLTLPEDIADREQARPVIYALSERVAGQLRKEHLCARGVQLTVKSNEFHNFDRQKQLPSPSQFSGDLAEAAMTLLERRELWLRPIRLLGIRAIELQEEDAPRQLSLFESEEERGRRQALTGALDALREKYGPGIIRRGVLMEDKKEE